MAELLPLKVSLPAYQSVCLSCYQKESVDPEEIFISSTEARNIVRRMVYKI